MELKKNEDKWVERKMPLFYLIGLNIALFLTIVAFEWKTVDGGIIDLGNLANEEKWIDETVVLPPEPIPIPPRPKPEIKIKEVTEEPMDVPEVIFDAEVPDEGIPEIDFEPLPPVVVEEAVSIVENMPEFSGGFEAFYKLVSKKINTLHRIEE